MSHTCAAAETTESPIKCVFVSYSQVNVKVNHRVIPLTRFTSTCAVTQRPLEPSAAICTPRVWRAVGATFDHENYSERSKREDSALSLRSKMTNWLCVQALEHKV